MVLILVVVFLALSGLLWVGTLAIQGYWYTEPTTGVSWRAPAAAAVLTLLLALWTFLAHRSPGRYDTFFAFNPSEVKELPKRLWAVKPGGQKTLFELRKNAQGRPEYRDPQNSQRWSRSQAVIIEEVGQEVRFEADRDEQGNYKIEKGAAPSGLGWLVGSGSEKPLQYRDGRGRVMTEADIGRLSTTRYGLLLGNLFLNAVHLVLWFVCLWLLLRFQWPHALGLAVVLWLVMTITILPMIFGQAGATTPPRPAAATPTAYKICMMSPSWTT